MKIFARFARITIFLIAFSLIFNVAHAQECTSAKEVITQIEQTSNTKTQAYTGEKLRDIEQRVLKVAPQVPIAEADRVTFVFDLEGDTSFMIFAKENCVLEVGIVPTKQLRLLALTVDHGHT